MLFRGLVWLFDCGFGFRRWWALRIAAEGLAGQALGVERIGEWQAAQLLEAG